MILNSLFESRFQQYFDELFSRHALWLFVHVPKTAGSSLNTELVATLAPSHHIFVDYTALDRRPFDEMLDESVDRFIELAAAKRYAYCTGHIADRHVRRIAAALPATRPITLLRDPVARVVSDYRYQCSPMHPGHAAFKATHPSIDSYIEIDGEWNKASAHLVPDALRHDPAACIEHLVATYAVVGIQESYALSLRLVTTLAGAPRRPTVRKRINTPTAETAVDLTPAQDARIRACNALDIAIYAGLARRFTEIEGALTEYLDRIDPLPPE